MAVGAYCSCMLVAGHASCWWLIDTDKLQPSFLASDGGQDDVAIDIVDSQSIIY